MLTQNRRLTFMIYYTPWASHPLRSIRKNIRRQKVPKIDPKMQSGRKMPKIRWSGWLLTYFRMTGSGVCRTFMIYYTPWASHPLRSIRKNIRRQKVHKIDRKCNLEEKCQKSGDPDDFWPISWWLAQGCWSASPIRKFIWSLNLLYNYNDV